MSPVKVRDNGPSVWFDVTGVTVFLMTKVTDDWKQF
jgi:hypothetical protein